VHIYKCVYIYTEVVVSCLRKREHKSSAPTGALSHTIIASSPLIMDGVEWALRHSLLLTVSVRL